MRDDEFLETMLNNHIYLAENWRECRTDVPPIEGEIPDSVNWAATGAVTSVKDQNNCISSWAFSAIGVMEAYNVLQFNRTLTTLSAQNLIDCSQYLGNYGCYGGDIISAFKYVRENGIDTDSTYPYVAKEPNECVHKKNNSIGNLAQDFRCLIEGDEDQLKAVVSKFGPVAVSVDARRWDFRFYKSGIYYSDECCNYNHCLNHAMLVVGYGTQDETDYWLLKNTWGESWGENGYMKIARNRNNTCGVATAGIFQLENCITSFKGLDHAMLIVGYGNEEGKDFWLVKNSWGKEWGLDGYIKVARNADNNCEIATLAIYPVATVIVDRICHFFQLFVTN
ncbi:hypothetical protein V9T40_007183 [Parthenolecanium corni]|uniref:Peptidase C1A papain C-terminal domain-containing protein n=1 Tax=Parthenolecanium corni TaxID=536013 RepID=A0AAN9TUH1_9HEMI